MSPYQSSTGPVALSIRKEIKLIDELPFPYIHPHIPRRARTSLGEAYAV